MRTFRILIPTLVLGGALSALSLPARAAEQSITLDTDGRLTTTVSVRDLDLERPEDVQELYVRVRDAAVAVCDTVARREWLGGQLPPAGWQSRCVRSAVNDAVRSLGSRNLSVLHYESQGLIAKTR